jgi:hypothetical protein
MNLGVVSMRLMEKACACAVALAMVAASAPALAVYELGCDEPKLLEMIKWCVDPATQLSDYQKEGRDNIIKGRFCDEPLLITDGTQICWNHDIENMKHSWVCKPEFHVTAATALLAENDPRKPAKCGR